MIKAKRFLSVLLALCLVLGMIPGMALASSSKLPFTDVKTTDWFYESVQYAYDNGIMNGTSSTTFSPDYTTERGMIVTVLHRMEGTPSASGTSFSDVAPGQYYADAVAWASANDIVNGYGDGNFGPTDPITREQMATILYRYADHKGYDTAATENISSFSDADQVSSFAEDSMSWAVGSELITGIGNNLLDPKGNATRAQMATILMRFDNEVAQKDSKPTETPSAKPTESSEPDANTYTVTFDPNYSGSETFTRTVKAGETLKNPSTPGRGSYTFSGWYTDATNGSKFDFSQPINSNLTLYAHWSANNNGSSSSTGGSWFPSGNDTTTYYTVTFIANAHNVEGLPATQSVIYGGYASEPTAPTLAGYVFGGWYTDTACTNRFSFTTPITTYTTLYAKWTAVDTTFYYTVTFNANGSNVVNLPQLQSVRAGERATEPANPTRAGYTFGGWFTDLTCTNSFSFTTAIHANTILYAKWIAQGPSATYVVTFNSNGGSAVPQQNVTANGYAVRPADPTREGYTFVGWYTNSNLVTLYNFERTAVTSNITLYARWNQESAEEHTFLDDPDPDVEVYSFDIDVRSIPVGETKEVTFYAEVFANIALAETDVSVINQDDTLIGYMYDDGLAEHGDETAGDGIYSFKTTLSSDVAKYDEYCAVVKGIKSEILGIGFYTPFTEAELTKMEEVHTTIEATVRSDEFTGAANDEKRQMLETVFEELVAGGQIVSYNYDESSKTFTYEHASGVQGIFEMPSNSDKPLNGLASSSDTVQDVSQANSPALSDNSYSDNLSSRAATLSSAKALILNGFIVNDSSVDNSYRRDFYVSLKSAWEEIGIQTTIDEDVTVADMKALNQGNNDIIVFAMHGGHAGNSVCGLCLNEKATSVTDAAYNYELTTRNTVYESWTTHNSNAIYRSYGVRPQFFRDNYSSHALQDKLLFSESCMFYGCDDGATSKAPDHTFANTFKALSAGAVVGYHNSVGADYSRDVMKLTIEEAFKGNTISDALSTATQTYGANDNWQDSDDDKWIAYPVISNNDDQFMLVGSGIAAGTVRDATNNEAVSNALIRVCSTDGTVLKRVRTDSSGNYSIEMLAGDYIIKVTAGHYKSAKMAVTIVPDNTTYTETLLLLDAGLTTGYANGRITNAVVSDLGVSNVRIRMRLGWGNRSGTVLHTTTTNENGYYEISFLSGMYTIEYSKSGYVTGYKNILIGPIDLAAQNAVIAPLTSEDEYSIVLTWQDHPSDLDAHLAGPTDNGGRFHLYYPLAEENGSSSYSDYVTLDLDNVSIETRSDPETITIKQQLDGKYVYSIHDYSNGGHASSLSMSTSNATIVVRKGSTEIATFHVPTNVAGTIWTVFELEGDVITPINRFSNGYADDVALFDPYNTEPVAQSYESRASVKPTKDSADSEVDEAADPVETTAPSDVEQPAKEEAEIPSGTNEGKTDEEVKELDNAQNKEQPNDNESAEIQGAEVLEPSEE